MTRKTERTDRDHCRNGRLMDTATPADVAQNLALDLFVQLWRMSTFNCSAWNAWPEVDAELLERGLLAPNYRDTRGPSRLTPLGRKVLQIRHFKTEDLWALLAQQRKRLETVAARAETGASSFDR